jgi:hypothetical protein
MAVSISTFMVKRGARYAGERGLFCGNSMSEDDFEPVAMDTEVQVEIKSERQLSTLKFIWGLATILAEQTEWFLDKEDAVNGPQGLKILARHCKLVTDLKTGEVTLRPMSMARKSNEAMQRLKNRMIYVVVTKLMPGMDSETLRKEVEAYIGGTKEEATK